MSTDNKFISTDTLSNLFQVTRSHHRRKLREIFRVHYKPYETDKIWTTNLSEQVINDLRLHLSWDLGIRTFDWNREAIGTRIIHRFKELGILLFITKIIMDDHNK